MVFLKKCDFSACGFLGLHARETTVSATLFVNFPQNCKNGLPSCTWFEAFFCPAFLGAWTFLACMRTKPQFRQHFILMFLDMRAHVSARSGSDTFFVFLSCVFFSQVLWVLDSCRVHARESPVSATFYLHVFSHSCPRFCEKRLGQFFVWLCLSCHFVAAASCGFWIFCRVHAPEAAVLAPVSSEFDFPSCSKSIR